MRFVKPYNPVVIDLISRNLLHDPSKLHVLIYFYATSKQEQDMRFVHNDFLIKLQKSVLINIASLPFFTL